MTVRLTLLSVRTKIGRMLARKSELSSDFVETLNLLLAEFLRSAKLSCLV